MSGFIHAEINWDERPDVVRANVQRMLDPVAHYPWGSTSIVDVSASPVSCVLAAQRDRGTSHHESGVAARGPVHVVADIRLDAKQELAHELGISAGEALLLSDEALVLRAYQQRGLRTSCWAMVPLHSGTQRLNDWSAGATQQECDRCITATYQVDGS